MQIIDLNQLDERVGLLRHKGVTVPKKLPPQNLDPSTNWFRGFLAEIQSVDLLLNEFAPQTIEMKMPGIEGDVDIIIHQNPKLYLQVKNWEAQKISTKRNLLSLDQLIDKSKSMIEERIKSVSATGSTYTQLEIKLNDDEEPALYGQTVNVIHPYVAHLIILNLNSGLFERIIVNKIQRSIDKSYQQLKEFSEGLLIPIINLSRYPHNQKELILLIKNMFTENTHWKTISGILLLTNSYQKTTLASGFHGSKLRIIGITNPNIPIEKQLNVYDFNSNHDDEELFDENMVIIQSIPIGAGFEIRDGYFYLNDIVFKKMPSQLGGPFAIRISQKAKKSN